MVGRPTLVASITAGAVVAVMGGAFAVASIRPAEPAPVAAEVTVEPVDEPSAALVDPRSVSLPDSTVLPSVEASVEVPVVDAPVVETEEPVVVQPAPPTSMTPPAPAAPPAVAPAPDEVIVPDYSIGGPGADFDPNAGPTLSTPADDSVTAPSAP